jgi:hypothetical protein
MLKCCTHRMDVLYYCRKVKTTAWWILSYLQLAGTYFITLPQDKITLIYFGALVLTCQIRPSDVPSAQCTTYSYIDSLGHELILTNERKPMIFFLWRLNLQNKALTLVAITFFSRFLWKIWWANELSSVSKLQDRWLSAHYDVVGAWR